MVIGLAYYSRTRVTRGVSEFIVGWLSSRAVVEKALEEVVRMLLS